MLVVHGDRLPPACGDARFPVRSGTAGEGVLRASKSSVRCRRVTWPRAPACAAAPSRALPAVIGQD